MTVRSAQVKAVSAIASAACLFISSCCPVRTLPENDAELAPAYHVIRKLPLGGEGRWDYLTIDSAARRLYISRSTHVMVVDVDSEKIVGDIPGTEGVHGIAVAPELNRGFTSNGRSNTATIFDLRTLKVIGQVKTGQNPDCIIYDPASKRVFTFNGRSKDATAFDAATGEVAGTIALGGKPEYAAADERGSVYVNIEDTSEVAEIDSAKLVVTKRFPLAPGEEPSGLALDAKHHLVFSGCHNKVMTVLDVNAGSVIATISIGSGVDGNGLDPGTGLSFSANSDGTLTVVSRVAKIEPPYAGFDHDGIITRFFYEVLQTVQTKSGARTMAVDLKTHNIYLPTAQFEPPPAPTTENPRPRPTMIKDSFMVLVVGE
jgi:DNA-binding beta-propeller fold protein YncE